MNPVVHFEIPAKNRKRVAEFYTKAFGWKTNQLGEEMGHYVLAQTTECNKKRMPKKAGRINGGFFQKKYDMPGQYPSVVISVKNIRGHMKKVKAAGGKVLGEPWTIPGVGQYVAFIDSEGNRLSMIQTVGC